MYEVVKHIYFEGLRRDYIQNMIEVDYIVLTVNLSTTDEGTLCLTSSTCKTSMSDKEQD